MTVTLQARPSLVTENHHSEAPRRGDRQAEHLNAASC